MQTYEGGGGAEKRQGTSERGREGRRLGAQQEGREGGWVGMQSPPPSALTHRPTLQAHPRTLQTAFSHTWITTTTLRCFLKARRSGNILQ
jgi:hypothetical protein